MACLSFRYRLKMPAPRRDSPTKLYEGIKGARLTARKADGRTLIEAAELHRIVRELPAIGRQPDTATAKITA